VGFPSNVTHATYARKYVTNAMNTKKYTTNVVDGMAVLIIIHNPLLLGHLLLQFNAAQQNEF